jgi:hypothetical protein
MRPEAEAECVVAMVGYYNIYCIQYTVNMYVLVQRYIGFHRMDIFVVGW